MKYSLHYTSLLLSTACLLLLFDAGCQQAELATPSNTSSEKVQRTWQLAVIPKGTTHEFWKSVHAGAIKARMELEKPDEKIQIIWSGPLREDDRDAQIKVVENFIPQKVDGIVLAPLDEKALARPVSMAVRRGIPVVVIDSALESDEITSFIATDNYKGGQIAARHMAKIVPNDAAVLVLRYQVGSASTDQREKGFMDTLAKEFPSLNIISSDQYAGATREKAHQASQSLLARYGSEAHAVFTPNESSTAGMMLALSESLYKDKIIHVGFDASPSLIAGLENGSIRALIVQDPMEMGYQGVKKLMDQLRGKEVPKQMDTAVQLVTLETMREPQIQSVLYPPLDQYLSTTP